MSDLSGVSLNEICFQRPYNSFDPFFVAFGLSRRSSSLMEGINAKIGMRMRVKAEYKTVNPKLLKCI
jgi:hypothetical protein